MQSNNNLAPNQEILKFSKEAPSRLIMMDQEKGTP
jgi:hypothetical protein